MGTISAAKGRHGPTLAVAFMKNRGNLRYVHLSNNEGADGASELMNEITRLKKDYSSRMKEIESLKGKLQKCEDDKDELRKDVKAAKADIDWIECPLCSEFKDDMHMILSCGHWPVCFYCLHQREKNEMLEKCPFCMKDIV